MLDWGLELLLFRFLNLSCLKHYSVLFALFAYAHTILHRLKLIWKQKQENHSIAIILFLMKTDIVFPFVTAVIGIIPDQDGCYEISGKKKNLYSISQLCSQGGTSTCAWPFQGSAVWLDGCLHYHLLQPLLHVRNQGGWGRQSNTEYWKGYCSATDYSLSWTAMVINIPASHSNDKDCNKNRWGQSMNVIFLTMIDP